MDADKYLERIGAGRPEKADLGALRELQLRHLKTVPFENLSIHLGEPIVLEQEALYRKVVERKRGGFCYELNGLFGGLLTELGYQVTYLAAKVNGGPLFDHLALRVDLDEPWLVDVGFGRFSHYPLRLDTAEPQDDPAGKFVLTRTADGDVEVTLNGQHEYVVETRPRPMSDFEPTCWWHQTSPKSHFTRSLTCSLLTDEGRITLSGHTLITTTDAAGRQEQVLDDEGVLTAYQRIFGFVLDRLPVVSAVSR
ncbi:arylamine N-acetyltransferase family protein [Catelliglobosispora koreensis]|uniref:arylamine N-acetyltransferase family protein n=1 Tax=Catelliglobosispora koreensis TaxID=129052 RepID=UPI00036023A5|nr:arylamine N-acetyltransferase [Catelliglobosispora koreensis]